MSGWIPTPEDTPFARLGGEQTVRRIVDAFYDHMDVHEPALARLHPCDEQGRVLPENRERFALFLIGWLGGPQHYVKTHGHPRLRMRHAHVAVDTNQRDAWVRSMTAALNQCEITGEVRGFLETRFFDVADFLRNTMG